MRWRHDFVLGSHQKLTGVQVQELFLVWPNRRHVIRGVEDTSDAGNVVEPKLGGAVDLVVRKTWKRIAGCMALDITPHVLLDLRQRAEQGCVLIAVIGDELVMAHLRLAAKKDGHLDYVKLQC